MFGKIKKNYFLLITTFLFLYFFFNFLDGERGLISYYEKQNIKKELIQEKELLILQLKVTEKKNSLLSEKIDLDYLETLYRKNFMVGKSNERIYTNN